MARKVTFVTGPDCGLCRRAWSRLRPLRVLGRVDVVDVAEHTRFLERIPVVLGDDESVVWEEADGRHPLAPVTRFLLTGK